MTVANANPTVTFTARDGAGFGGITGDATKVLIKGVSYVLYEIAASGKKGATIKSYSVTNGSNTRSTASGEFWISSNNGTFNYVVTDSRGNTTKGTYTFSVVDYIVPTCNISATNPTAAGDMVLKISGNIFFGAIGKSENVINLTYRYKENNGSYTAWKYPTETTLGNNTYSTTINISGLNYKSTYTIEARVEDLIFTDSNYKGGIYSEAIKVKSIPVFDWGENDFNFNVPVTIEGEPLLDYVVEQGGSGIWKYRKWHSGYAECWGTSNTREVTCDTAWGSMFCKDDALPPITYPFEFVAAPVVQVTFDYAGQYNYWTYTSSAYVGTAKQTPSYGACRPTTATVRVKAHYYAIGRWR